MMARSKKKKRTLPVVYLYAAGFVLGTLVSTLVFLVMVTYPATGESSLLNNASYGLRVSVDTLFNWGRKEVYGRVEVIDNQTIILTSNRSGIPRMYTMKFDEQTKFYMFAPDEELSEVLLTPQDIEPGQYASFTTEESVGSKKNQKIISLLVM